MLATYTCALGACARSARIARWKPARKPATEVISATEDRQASLAPTSTATSSGRWAPAGSSARPGPPIRAPVTAYRPAG
ncbi:hypothetical protein SFUMM280S_08076 [Streptomyces fumanus]